MIGGKNFGCGSSREHAPLALAEAGIVAVVAEFYARIFFATRSTAATSSHSRATTPDRSDQNGDQLEIETERGILTTAHRARRTSSNRSATCSLSSKQAASSPTRNRVECCREGSGFRDQGTDSK